ncbi:MAG: enolase [Pyrinomonadaceae bacterium]|nr:enolase [Pyrinomonadaceae bacterium]
MKIISGKIYALQIPFVEAFAHSAKTRKFSDSFVVRLTAEDGANGYGEGVARQYVTGETVETSIAFIKNHIFPLIETTDFDHIKIDAEPLNSLEQISGIFTDEDFANNVVFHAARAAIESALIDCLLKSGRKSLAQILPPKRDFVTYSGVITTGTTEKAVQHAKRFKLFGISQLKIKIANDENDVSRVAAIRQAVGERVSLRLDANAAFDLKGAIAMSEKMFRFGVDVIEQPIPRGNLSEWAELKKRSMIPIMADESIVTRADAQELIENRACDFFNLRISKCGGIANVLKLAQTAQKAGIRLQLGCQVGETSILSAVGRHVAAHLETLEYVEGSFGNLLLTEDVGRTNINFGHGGRAPLIRGDGIGIEIREEILEKYAIHIETLVINH